MNQVMYSRLLFPSLVGLLVATSSALAGTSAIEGFVKDPSGRPIKGAVVRIEGKNFSKIAKTDAKGHYISDNLAVGTYKVTLLVDGQVKASILDGKAQPGKVSQLNFNLTGKMAPAKKHTRMVWIPPDINTRIGGGRWVEVDDNGNIVNDAGFNNVERVRGPAVQAMEIRVSTHH
jgi:hypothetical protein